DRRTFPQRKKTDAALPGDDLGGEFRLFHRGGQVRGDHGGEEGPRSQLTADLPERQYLFDRTETDATVLLGHSQAEDSALSAGSPCVVADRVRLVRARTKCVARNFTAQ